MKQNWDQDVYLLAWQFAIKAHGNQTCPAAVEGERMPYAAHLGSVTMEVVAALHSNPNLDGNLAIQCALLHDTIEDTDVDYTMIEEHFGRNVASGVLALTKDKKLPTKKEQLLDSLERIILQPHEVWMVKLADRISNLQPPPLHWNGAKCQAYREEAQLIHDYLHASNAVLSQRLAEKIEGYKQYMDFKNNTPD